MKPIKWLFSLLAIMILLIPLISCSKTTSVQTVRVGEVTRSIFYAPQYVAISKGFFEEEGLKVDLKTTWGGDKTMTSLLSDGIDVALVGSETSIYVYAQGSSDPVINFAQLTQTDGTFLVARKKVDHFSWDQLKGKTFLGQRKGGMPQMVGEYVLKQHNIDPKKDVKLVQNIDFANVANAFASGTGDYVQLFEPTASILEQQGKGHIVASFGKESGTVPYTTFMAKESYLKDNPEAAAKFTRAIYKAQKWVNTHNTDEIAEVVAPYFEDTPKETLKTVIDRYKSQKSFATNPLLDQKEWDHLQKIMDESGELPRHIDHSKLVNTKFAKDAMSE